LVKVPDVLRQHEKTPAWVRRVRKYLDAKGVEQVNIEKVIATEGTGDQMKVLRWHELADRIEERIKNATVAQLKTFYQSLADEPYAGAQTKAAIALAIVKQYFDVSTVAEFKAKMVGEGRWGLGCPHGCGRFWEFKPRDDLLGFEVVDPAARTGKQAEVLETFDVEVGAVYDEKGNKIKDGVMEKRYRILRWNGEEMVVSEVPVNRGYLDFQKTGFTCDRCGKGVTLE